MSLDFRLHHIGVVVEDLDKAAAQYTERYGYTVASPVMEDGIQTARAQFLKLKPDSSYLELLTPIGRNSKLADAVRKLRLLNHMCYVVEDLDAACAALREQGMVLLQAPLEAMPFRPRRMAWLIGSDGIAIELVETGKDWWA